MMAAALQSAWQRSKFHGTEDLVFANKVGNPLDTHNLLHRHVKPAAVKLGLPKTVDFRSFRTMHASLMRRTGARPEAIRDNMGHSQVSMTMDGYSRSWWDERVCAVSQAVADVFAAPAAAPPDQTKNADNQPEGKKKTDWVPFWGCPNGDPVPQPS